MGQLSLLLLLLTTLLATHYQKTDAAPDNSSSSGLSSGSSRGLRTSSVSCTAVLWHAARTTRSVAGVDIILLKVHCSALVVYLDL